VSKMKIFILAFVCFFISSAAAESILNESAFTQRYANAVITKTEVVSADIKKHTNANMNIFILLTYFLINRRAYDFLF